MWWFYPLCPQSPAWPLGEKWRQEEGLGEDVLIQRHVPEVGEMVQTWEGPGQVLMLYGAGSTRHSALETSSDGPVRPIQMAESEKWPKVTFLEGK